MWTYKQSTGELSSPGGKVIATGYAGHGVGENNPADQEISGVGPLPEGLYDIGPLHDEPVEGVDCMLLTPQHGTNVYGRGPFLMHGDSSLHPGQASLGCIIMPHPVRLAVGQSEDKVLQVIA
jgi:hypothetical protein